LVFELCFTIISLTENHSKFTGSSRGFDTQDMSQLRHHICTTRGALVQVDSTSDQGFCITGTTWKTAGSTIGPRQDINCGKFARIDVNSKLFGGEAKGNGGDHTDASEAQYSCEHKISL
jgi:hypothetical protein